MNPIPSPRWKSNSMELFVLQETDVTDEYVAWLNNSEVNRFLECRFTIHDKDNVRDFIRTNLADPASLFCGIRTSILSGKHVGNIKLSLIDKHHGLAEVGIMIGDEAAWGHGIGTEAIRMISEIAHHELGLRKLTAGCYSSNAGSRIAFQRAGFEISGERKEHFLLNGNPEALILLDLIL
jgi:ribosomal-protein-alanine N-acetyltransferase